MEFLFWISLSILLYAYIGYGLLLSFLSLLQKGRQADLPDVLIPVTVIIPAYNEQAVIGKKIENCLALDYPAHLLTFLFITDGSTDDTVEIIKKYPVLHLLHQAERRGKTAAINRAMQHVKTPVVVFTDANAMLHPGSLRIMLRHYANEQIGGVSGEKRILRTDDTAVSTGERIYWQYESMLKKADASFYTVIGAAGELFSIRTALFEPLDELIILDDFVLSAKVCLKGYRFAYEQDAFAQETASVSMAEERKRKVRISAGCFQALVLLKDLLKPGKNWRLTFQYLSHRVLRWILCPVCILLLFIANAFLYAWSTGNLYAFFFWGQCIFYLLAIIGWLKSEKSGFPKILFIPYYFVFMNFSLFAGFYRFLTGQQSAIWKKATRKLYS